MELCVGKVNYNEITFYMTGEQIILNITPRFLLDHPELKLILITEMNEDGIIYRQISSNSAAQLSDATESSLSFLYHYWSEGHPVTTGRFFIASGPDEFFVLDL